MTKAPQLVVVLQAVQPLTADPATVFPGENCEVAVVSVTDGGAVLREDVADSAAPVHRLPRAQWAEGIRRLANGRPFEVATNDEYCLLECQALRAQLGLDPRHPDPLHGYLDKVVMKRRLNRCGVATARYIELATVPADAGLARRWAGELGLPLVAKPRQEANSRGVDVLRDVDDIQRWQHARRGLAGWHLEEFLAGTQYHVNGIVCDGVVTPVQVGHYRGPLLGFFGGRRLGGTTLPPSDPLVPVAHRLNEAVVAALGGAGRFIVHTEFMLRPDGSTAVLEVAARAPGAMVSEAARLHTGVNLESCNLALQAGAPAATAGWTGFDAGWLWVPVLPGEAFRRGPEFSGHSRVHIRRAAREGNRRGRVLLGASVLLWSKDDEELAADMELAATWDWTQ
jgi:biotin carboxylase